MNIRSLALWSLFVLTAVCASAGPQPLAGGYSGIELTPEVRKAAEFAVSEEAKKESAPLKLGEISSAERQVVAGLNYKLTLNVTMADGKTRKAKAVVYEPLNHQTKLTSWEWLP